MDLHSTDLENSEVRWGELYSLALSPPEPDLDLTPETNDCAQLITENTTRKTEDKLHKTILQNPAQENRWQSSGTYWSLKAPVHSFSPQGFLSLTRLTFSLPLSLPTRPGSPRVTLLTSVMP